MGREPVHAGLLWRGRLPPCAPARPLIADPLASPDRGGPARRAAGRDHRCGHTNRGSAARAPGAGHDRHQRTDQGRSPPDRQPPPPARHRMAQPTGQATRDPAAPVVSAPGHPRQARLLRGAPRPRRGGGRLVHTRGHAQAMRYVRRMRTWLGRLDRDVGRKIAGDAALEAAFATARARIARLLAQRPEDPNKIYALHAPEVECIAKGKARIRYEFGVKLSLAVTNARAEGGQFVLGVRTLPGNPYDGHTLGAQIEQVERLTGRPVKRAYVDRGYRGHKLDGPTQTFVSHTRGIVPPTIRRELRRRNAIEPVIGHLKSDGLVERNRLLGAHGDAINAILAAAGHNLRLLVAWLRALCALLWAALVVRHDACRATPTPA